MANSDKDIRVVPNRNKSGLPNIAFTGYNNDPIVLNVLDDNTISFEGSSGQLFSVSNAVTTGTIFSVNDISGIPSFRVDADGTVGIAEFSGNVGIGLQSPQSKLSVGGDINVGAGYTFRVAGTKVLDSSSLGTGVTGSSLTSVGTINSGTWQGTAIGVNYGGTGATNASDARSFIGAATAGTNSDLTRLLGVQHLFVTIPTAAAIGITVKAATSQSASMMEFVNSSNSLLAWITKDGTFAHGAYFTHNDGRVPGISVQRANAAGIVARGFNSDAFPAIEVQNNPGGLSVGLYPSGLVYGGVLQAYSSTASTNTTTGALIVAGGAAIAGTTNFGRDVRIFSSLASSSPFTGSLVVSGGVGISNNLFVGGGVAFTSSIASTSTATGTLVVTGGVGIGGSVFTSTSNASSISGVVLSNGSVTLTGTYTQSNSSTTAFQVRDGSNNPAFVIDTIGDVISLPVAVASTSTSSGSLVVAGGVGIGGTLNVKSLYVDNDLFHIPGVGNTFNNSWTSITLPSEFTMSGMRVIYAENRFVATGGSVVAYSSDVVNWTRSFIPWPSALTCQSIAYGNGYYVVTPSLSSYVAYSTDLINWSLASVQYQNYETIAYGNGRFVANSGAIVGISTNGVNWSSHTPTGAGLNYQFIKFINGYFYSTASRSIDGIFWEPINISVSVSGLDYGNGLYFGAQYNSPNYAFSIDGLNFTSATVEDNVYRGAEYHNGVYYLRTQANNPKLYYSFNGKNYQSVSTPGSITTMSMAFGKNKIVIFGFTSGTTPLAYFAEAANGKIDLNPIREGNIDNTFIGRRVPKPANFTDLSATGYVNIVNQAGSASTTSGALVVRGGVGIGQSVYIGGKLDVSNTINYVATNSGIANTWTRIAIPSPVSISGLTYGNGLYVGVGYSAATSTDGITWTARSLPHNLTTVGYGNNLYVGVNGGSALGATSTDGITWRSMALPASANWDGIAYGNGVYVISATHNQNLIAYSYNGFNWTLGSISLPGGFFVLRPVIFGGGYFYTGSYAGTYNYTSIDGINWTLRTGHIAVATNQSTYGDGAWLISGSSASLSYTKDFITWTYSGHYGWSGQANYPAYTNGTFAIVDGGSLQCTLIYKNLSTVVLSNLPGPSYATTITAGEGKFIAGAGSTVYVTDVASHTYNIFPHNSGDINNVRIGAKFPSAAQFTVLNATSLVSFGATTPSVSTSTGALVVKGGVGIGETLNVAGSVNVSNSLNLVNTTTGIATTWTRTVVGTGATISYLAYANNLYVGVGYSSLTSTDGVNWTTRTLPNDLSFVSYGNGIWSGLLYGSALGATSTNGTSWTSYAMTNNRAWTMMAFGNGKFVTLARSTNIAAYSTNGYNWTEVTMPTSQVWVWVTYGGGYFVGVANGSATAVYSTDGINWNTTTLPSAGGWGRITYGNGYYFVVGSGNLGAYSKDLINWTNYPLNVNGGNTLYSEYNNGTFVVVDASIGTNSNIITGDFSSRTAVAIPFTQSLAALVAGDRVFIAGYGQTFYTFPIPNNSITLSPNTTGEINNVEIGNTKPASGAFSNIFSQGLVAIGATARSISPYTGALVVAGGVGIGGSLFVGNTLSVASSTASTSTTTGALIVSGGVGIGGSFNAGGVVRSGQLIAPTFTLSALGNTGALIPSTTYYYKLSSLDYFGNESLPSNEASIALNSSTYAVNIAPNIDQSIYAIKIYRTTTSNSYTNSLVDTYYPFRGASNASNIPYNYYDRGKSTSSSSPVTVSTANRAVLGSSINSTLGKLNLAGQLLIQSKNASAPSANIGIQLGNYDIAAVKDGLLAYFSSITSATGGTLTAGTTYYYIMTGVDGYGNETFPSKEFPFLADANGAAQMNIGGGDYGIIKYRFYRTTNPGNYTNCFIGELPDFKDINYPTQNVSPPTSSSANAYVLKSTPQENIPSYIDSLDLRPGMYGALRKLADNGYNTISGIVTSGIAGTLAQNTNYFYKVAAYDRYGNTTSASSPYIINTGPATSVQITPMGVDWPIGVEGFLVYRSTSKDNFNNVPTFYAYPGTAITDTGNYEFISSAPTANNYLLGNFGTYYYGYANFYLRSLDIAAGGNQSSMNFLSARSSQPTITAATGGTLTPGSIYYYKVMVFGRGDDYSMASPAVRFVVGAGGAARISVGTINIASYRHYNIYRTADLSNWTNSQIARYVSETDFVDIGYPSEAGSPVGHSGVKRGTVTTISDGTINTFAIRVNSFTQDIAAPGGITISGTTGGILTTNTTYYYRIMAVGVGWAEFGQASKQVIYTTTDTQNAISLSWGLVPNATGYRVLRSTTNNAGAGQTYTFVHGTSFVDKGYSTTTHPYDPYALYYPGSYGATLNPSQNRFHLPFLNITNGENPALTVSMLPPIISSTSTGTGGTLENNTNYYYIVEAYDYNGGSSLPSTEVVVNTGANNSVTLTWTEKNGAFYHKVYRSSNSDFTNKQINQTVYTNTFTDINYPTVNTSPRYSSTNGSMYRIGTVNTSGVYHGLFSRSVFQTTPTPQGAYGTDYAVKIPGRPANTIYGSLFELGDFQVSGFAGSTSGTYFGLSSATGFTGNYIDLQLSSISRFKVDYLGNATIGSTTGSGSTSTGALIVTGGVGIGQSLFTSPSYSSSISGAIFSNGSATLSGSFTQNNSSTTAFQVRDGSNNPTFVIDTIADIVSLPVSVASTSTGTGSLVVSGGVGIGGTLNVGSVNVINNINYYPATGSTGGIAWSTISLPAGVSGITKMIYANNKFVGVGNTFAVYSNDGLNWSSVNFTGFSSSENFNNLAFGSGKYVALAGSAATVALYSTDAITWTRSFLPASRVVFRGFAYGNGYFVGIDQSNIPVRSTDGINWTSASGLAGYSRDVKFINGQFIAILWLATNEDFTYTSTDGVDWTRLSIPLVISYGITYGNGKYLASSIGTTSPIVSTDLVNWTRLVKPAPYYDQLYTPSYHNGTFYIPTNYSQIIYSNDLVNWSFVNAANNELVYGADKLIIANGTSVLVSQSAQGKADISPFLNSSIENIRIGADNPDSATFTHLSALNNVSFTSPLNSTSTTTGALVVKGGVGIGGSINIGGRVGIGTNLLDATLNIRTSTAATPGVVIQGSTSQSASLFRVNSSVGGSFFEITNSGIVNIKTSTAGDYNSVPLQRWYGDSNSIVGVMQKGGFFYTGNGLGYVDDAGTQTLVHQWVPAGSYYITNWSQRMANGSSILFASAAGGAIYVGGDSNGSLTFSSGGTYTNNTMVKLRDPNYGTNQALLGIVTQDGSYTRSQLFSYGNLSINMTVAGSAGTDWDTTNVIRANIYTKTKYLGNLAILAVDDTNRFVVGPYGNTTVALGGTTASTGFIIKAASSQTGNLFEAQSSTGATLTFIDASGNASIGGTLNVSGSNSYFQNNLYVGNNTQGRLYFSQATLGSAGTTVIPTMAFIGATNSPITLSVLPDNSLSFDGSSGQLFSINNNLSTGWIFSINDISGLPIFRTNADLTVAMGEYGGNVGIGLSNPTFKLQVSGNAGISGTTLISNTTTSTNTTSGALVVSGGVGIGGSLNVTSASTISGVTINSGVITGSLTGTATTATYSHQSGYAITSGSSNTSGYATTSGLATTATNINTVATTSNDVGFITFSPVNGGSGVALSTNNNFYVVPADGYLSASWLDAIQIDGINSNITNLTGTAVTATNFYGRLTGTATTATNVNVVSASTSASHPVLFTPATGTASGAALSTESTFVYNPSTDILSVSGLAITSGTASTSPTTGALRVTGGVGISGRLNVGPRATTYSNPSFVEVLAGFATSFNGSAAVVIENLRPGDGIFSSLILKNPGGNGIISYLHYPGFGETTLTFNNSYGGMSFYTDGGLYSFYNGPVSIDPNGQPASTSTSTGALRVTGGAGIAKTSYFGEDVKIQGTTASGSTTTGALTVSGGVGIGQTLFTSSSYASSISGVILNNGAITNTGTITSTGVMSLSNSSTTALSIKDGSNSTKFNVNTIGGVVSVSSSTASTNTLTGALVVGGGLGVSGDLFICGNANSKLNIMQSSGDEGGEIFLNKPATNTTISSGVTIDVYQNKLRFFEAGGSSRGYFIDITSGGNGAGTNLVGGGSGTVTTLTAGTGISFSTGATITTTGTIRARRPLVASFCAGYTPAASGADSVVIRLPDSPSDGTTAITYEPQEFHIRVETASATTTTIQLEKYTGTGAFSGTAITSVSISGGSTYEAQTSVFAGAGIFLTSGDKLRINFTALSASHANFSVYLELEEV